MNIKDIKSLAQIMEDSGLTSVEVEEGNLKIKLERNYASLNTVLPATPIYSVGQQSPSSAPISALDEQLIIPEESTNTETVVDFNHIFEVKSPMVGIFYAAPKPDAEPFVKIGSKVKQGDVLCIIEAMKLMNEITAEKDGEVVDICVSTGQVVEYSQPMFKMF